MDFIFGVQKIKAVTTLHVAATEEVKDDCTVISSLFLHEHKFSRIVW